MAEAARPRVPRIVVGLGNPGARYAATRHNVGFDAADCLAHRLGASWRLRNGVLDVADGRRAARPYLLLKPMTYMNRSGAPLRLAFSDLGGRLEELLVLLDDFNLDLGRLRIRPGGSEGGHNGLRSIISMLGTQQIPRLRMGVGPPPEFEPVDQFVLKRFPPADRKLADEMVERAAEAAFEWLEGADLESLMNRYNRQ